MGEEKLAPPGMFSLYAEYGERLYLGFRPWRSLRRSQGKRMKSATCEKPWLLKERERKRSLKISENFFRHSFWSL